MRRHARKVDGRRDKGGLGRGGWEAGLRKRQVKSTIVQYFLHTVVRFCLRFSSETFSSKH